MSMSKVDVELKINTVLTLDDGGEIQAVSVSGIIDEIPNSGVRSLAQQAVNAYHGTDNHVYMVLITPVVEDSGEYVFEVSKRNSWR